MKLQIKYDINLACKMILQEHLDKFGIPFEITGLGDVEIKGAISPEQYKELEVSLKRYGIEILDNPKNAFIQKIKDVIVEMVHLDDKSQTSKVSVYLAERLNHSYGYLSSLFSEITHTSIENFIILQKIERAKQMIIEDKLTLTEMAWQLNYSSVAHLSNQFKKTTGLTPTTFQRIIKKRKNLDTAL
ncbi:MAG: AraC family transcriptional regulator [Flavobacterium sp.]|nr:AraC family transcriptional regulator [Flavobacterium sp.]